MKTLAESGERGYLLILRVVKEMPLLGGLTDTRTGTNAVRLLAIYGAYEL